MKNAIQQLTMAVAMLAISPCGCTTTPVSGGLDGAVSLDSSIEDGLASDQNSPDRQMQSDGKIVVNCPTDQFKNNHSQANAAVLSQHGDLTGLVVCAGQDDWYTLDVPVDYEMQFNGCTAKGAVPVEVDFFQEDFPHPQYYMGGGASGPSESCTGTNLTAAPRRYYFRIHTQAAQASYRIDLYLAPARLEVCKKEGAACSTTATCLSGFCRCNTDEFEPNNEPQSAKIFPLGVAKDLISCPADEDWYQIDSAGKTTLKIHLETSVLVGQGYFISLAIFDPQHLEEPLQFIGKTTWSEDYEVKLPKSGTYLVRTRAVNIPRNYKLSVTAQ